MEQVIWCDIDLESVPDYEVWKPESLAWALSIDWQQVNTLVRDHLDELPADLLGRWLSRSMHWNALSSLHREGLTSLYIEPIVATDAQISSGGHRITAMRQQGVRWALGQCLPSDVGDSVDVLHAYLTD